MGTRVLVGALWRIRRTGATMLKLLGNAVPRGVPRRNASGV
jgi:hypothetical protein